MLSELEKKIISLIQKDIPIVKRPYASMADTLGIDEKLFIETTKGLADRGIIRRYGATIKHQKAGFSANAMVAWKVEEAEAEKIGAVFADFESVSHCYYRPPKADWPYGLYTMIHAHSISDCETMAKDMADKSGLTDYILLFSTREFKKTSMEYFSVDGE